MTQDRPEYLTPEKFNNPNPATLREFNDPLYCAPTWEDIRAVKACYGLTGLEISKIIGVNVRTVRKYIANPETVKKYQHSKIPYAQWRMLLIFTKVVTPPLI